MTPGWTLRYGKSWRITKRPLNRIPALPAPKGIAHRKNNHPKRAWRQVRLQIEGLDWRLCGRAQTGISMVAKGSNAAPTGFPGLRSQEGIRLSNESSSRPVTVISSGWGIAALGHGCQRLAGL